MTRLFRPQQILGLFLLAAGVVIIFVQMVTIGWAAFAPFIAGVLIAYGVEHIYGHKDES